MPPAGFEPAIPASDRPQKNALEYDERYQLDVTIMIYYHKYLYMFRASICLSSGVEVVCCCIWCSALGVVAVVLTSRSVVLSPYNTPIHNPKINCISRACA